MSSYNQSWPKGMVYIMTNSPQANEIASFRILKDGTLMLRDFYATGGSGTDGGVDPLVSQNSLKLSRCGRFLFAVNAGSNTITSFMVMGDGGLVRASVVPSGGVNPNSLDEHGGILYVSNRGNSDSGVASNITGFTVDRCGVLSMIHCSTVPLSTDTAQPSCVLFSPNGKQLIVSEVNTNNLTVFRIKHDGTAVLQEVNPSSGAGPFGSVFVREGYLLVSEAGAGALSSYCLCANGHLKVISPSVSTGQTASCWVAAFEHGRYAYVSNTGSGSISVFRINEDGVLTLVETVLSTPADTPQGAPIDSGVSRSSRSFYVLNGNQGTISAFEINRNGTLDRIQVTSGNDIPEMGTQGLAVL